MYLLLSTGLLDTFSMKLEAIEEFIKYAYFMHFYTEFQFTPCPLPVQTEIVDLARIERFSRASL